ncbi:MAG: ABC transporter substrate-binding protein [Candidatus Thorarchaeota archaeon]
MSPFPHAKQKRKSLLLALLTLLLCVPHVSTLAQIEVSTPLKSGPYIDNILFSIISSDSQTVQALLDSEIDLIGTVIDPTYLLELSEAENVAVTSMPLSKYGYLTINTARYPFNITAFRRALAFALDKRQICQEAWNDLAVPLDSCVPQMSPWSAEELFEYDYYDADVQTGNELLDDAGFQDIDADGIREAPDGSKLNVTLYEFYMMSDARHVSTCEQVVDAFQAIGIESEVSHWDFWDSPDFFYINKDYDMAYLTSHLSGPGVEWLAEEYWSGNTDTPHVNFPRFSNASYDSWREQLQYSTDYDDVYEAAIAMQTILFEECPVIVCYEEVVHHAHRTDRFEDIVNDFRHGVSSWWTNYKAHFPDSQGGPFGGTLRWSVPADGDSFNLMVGSSFCARKVFLEMYDSLIIGSPEGADIGWLAQSFSAETHQDNPDVPTGRTRFTFDLIHNATWTDGHPLTAEDVAFTLNYYRDSPGNPHGAGLEDLVTVYSPSTYRVIVEFNTESYWHLYSIGYKPIIPKHVFIEIGLDGWEDWSPNPPGEPMVTSGPFNVSVYSRDSFIELTYNPGYFYHADRPVTTNDTLTPTPTGTTTPLDWFADFLENMDALDWTITISSLTIIAIVLTKWKLELSNVQQHTGSKSDKIEHQQSENNE